MLGLSLFNMMITINLTKVAGGTAVVLIYITPISLHISAYRYSEKTIKKMGDKIFVLVGEGGLSYYKIHDRSLAEKTIQQL